jgi:hypothetical protein
VSSDELTALGQRLAGLDNDPIGTHPAVLDEVHRALVGELERLAGVVSGEARAGRPGHVADRR